MGVQLEPTPPAVGAFPVHCPRSVVERSSGVPQPGAAVAGGWAPANAPAAGIPLPQPDDPLGSVSPCPAGGDTAFGLVGGWGRDKPPAAGWPVAGHEVLGGWAAAFGQDEFGCCKGVFAAGAVGHPALGFWAVPAPVGGATAGPAWPALKAAAARGSPAGAAVAAPGVGPAALAGGS